MSVLKKSISIALLTILITTQVSTQAFSENTTTNTPEFNLASGLMALAGNNLETTQDNQTFQNQVQSLVEQYQSNHTADPTAARKNLASALSILGMPDGEITKIQVLGSGLINSQSTLAPKDAANLFSTNLMKTLEASQAPGGEQFSSCNVSSTLFVLGLGGSLAAALLMAVAQAQATSGLAAVGLLVLTASVSIGGFIGITQDCH
jgi:hypothetical protein